MSSSILHPYQLTFPQLIAGFQPTHDARTMQFSGLEQPLPFTEENAKAFLDHAKAANLDFHRKYGPSLDRGIIAKFNGHDIENVRNFYSAPPLGSDEILIASCGIRNWTGLTIRERNTYRVMALGLKNSFSNCGVEQTKDCVQLDLHHRSVDKDAERKRSVCLSYVANTGSEELFSSSLAQTLTAPRAFFLGAVKMSSEEQSDFRLLQGLFQYIKDRHPMPFDQISVGYTEPSGRPCSVATLDANEEVTQKSKNLDQYRLGPSQRQLEWIASVSEDGMPFAKTFIQSSLEIDAKSGLYTYKFKIWNMGESLKGYNRELVHFLEERYQMDSMT